MESASLLDTAESFLEKAFSSTAAESEVGIVRTFEGKDKVITTTGIHGG